MGSFMKVNAHPYDCLLKNSHQLSQVTGCCKMEERKMEKKGGYWGLKLKLEYAIVLCFRNVAAATTALFFLGNARAKLK